MPQNVCPYPFSRIELGPNTYVPCCGSWLTPEYHQLSGGLDPWSGKAARALRKSQMDGSFKYCRTDICGGVYFDPEKTVENDSFETPITEEARQEILSGSTKFKNGPTSIAINIDPRCNLACPSCRKDFVNKVDWKEKLRMVQTEALLKKYRKSVEVIKLSGNGEVFFSPWLRQILKSLSPERFPKMREIFIISNGLLFNQKAFKDLAPGTQFIKYVSISVDAGTEDMYKTVRGGDWKRLMKNLQWMAEKRRNQEFKYFELTFTVREENFKTLIEFAKLGEDLGVDRIKLLPLLNWPMMKVNYWEEAIHSKEHPKHGEFLEVWDQIKHYPFVQSQFEL